jgi:1-deoxyxylulose-5-phosphate synthase
MTEQSALDEDLTQRWVKATSHERKAQFGSFLLGTGNIGGIAAATGPGLGLSDGEGIDLLNRAVERNVKVIDTADAYAGGHSEQVVGTWAKARAATTPLIQTKTGVTADGPNLSPDRIRHQLRRSLAVLGRVDLYIAHRVDPNTPWSESLPVFSEAVTKGVIRAYGLSNVDEAELTGALDTADRLGLRRPEIVQNAYSLIVRDDDHGVLPIVESEGLAYTPFSPLANGILAGRYSSGEQPHTTSRAANSPRAKGLLDAPEVIDRVRRFDELANTRQISSAALALAWLMNHPVVTAPIIGISNPSQWEAVDDAQRLVWTVDLATELTNIFPTF